MAETTTGTKCRACGGEGMACSACNGVGWVSSRRRAHEQIGDAYDNAFQDLRAHIDDCDHCGWLGNGCEQRESLIAAFLGLRSAVTLLTRKGRTND